ncbi:hypothetical protein RUND412_010769, partial [Rhizina undulata]
IRTLPKNAMKFKLTGLVFSILPAVITAAAISQDMTSCDGGSYEACVGNTVCVTVWPDSCYCLNRVNDQCAAACGVSAPASQDCTVDPEAIKARKAANTTCYEECLAGQACIQSWPQSCLCENEVKTDCVAACPGTVAPPLQDCGGAV